MNKRKFMMKTFTRTALSAALLTSAAFATPMATAADGGIHKQIRVSGNIVYSECTATTYSLNGGVYNGKPVYKRDGGSCRGANWYLFYHGSKWAISFQDPTVSPSHGVTGGLSSAWPWDKQWSGGAVVSHVNEVTISGNITYSDCTTGTFKTNGDIYNGKPVYENVAGICRGDKWYMFYHNSKWAISFEDPTVYPSHGVIAGLSSAWPWDSVWPSGAIVAK